MAHKVTSPLVVVKQANGRYVHVYEGGFLPDDADEEHVAQLVESGMVEETDHQPTDDDEAKPSRGRRSKPADTE